MMLRTGYQFGGKNPSAGLDCSGLVTHVYREAADMLGLSRAYLRNLRVSGGGCRFSKFGRAVRYRVGDLLAWANDNSASSTSEVA